MSTNAHEGSLRLECALCEKHSKLCDSHVIPEFLYAGLYDGTHRFVQVSTNLRHQPKLRQNGIYEKLLCPECEGRFAKWENYAVRVLRVLGSASGEHVAAHVRYSDFKLFGMSLLWRASVSRLPEFAGVDLGRHEGRVRSMLLAGDPGPQWEYGLTICRLGDYQSKGWIRESIVLPEHIEAQGVDGWRFFFGTDAWLFLASDAETAFARFVSLSEDGSLRLYAGGKHQEGYFENLRADIATSYSSHATIWQRWFRQ